MSDCNKKDNGAAAEPANTAAPKTEPAAAPPAAATPPAPTPAAPAPVADSPPPAAPAAAGDSGGVVPLAKLNAIMLPTPNGAPASGIWTNAMSPTGGTGDGDRLANFIDGKDYWVACRLLDCNHPKAKDALAKPEAERGDFKYCTATPTGKLKDFPLFAPSPLFRAVKAGHLIIRASIAGVAQGKVKPADLEAFLGSLDLAAISKL